MTPYKENKQYNKLYDILEINKLENLSSILCVKETFMPHFADVNLFILIYSRLQHPEGKKRKRKNKTFQQLIPFSVVTHHSSLVYQGQKVK